MKVRCDRCTLEEEINEEDVKLLSYMVKKYNPKPRPKDYMILLSAIKGNCNDGDKHNFRLDENYIQNVANTIKEYMEAVSENVERKVVLDKVSMQIEDMNQSLKDLEKKREYILAEMNAGGILLDNIKLKFIKLTGTEDMSIWQNTLE